MSSFENFVQCRIVTPFTAAATEIGLFAADTPHRLPAEGGGVLVLTDSPYRPSALEVIRYGRRSGMALYEVSRAQEGTAARDWTGVAFCYQALTAGELALLLAEKADVSALNGLRQEAQAALDSKVDKIAGKGLSSNDYTTGEKNKLANANLTALVGLTGVTDRLPYFSGAGAMSLAVLTAAARTLLAASTQAAQRTALNLFTDASGVVTEGSGALPNIVSLLLQSANAAAARVTLGTDDAGNLTKGTIPAARVPTLNQNTTGNAATATKLASSRTINGVAFDGSANITIADATKEPVIAAGSTSQFWRGDKTWADLATALRSAVLTGLSTASATAVAATDTLLVALGKLQAQITSLGTNKLDKTATAAAATKLANTRTINGVAFDGSANISISAPANGGTSAACSGNAATATKLATARTINGVPFDGSVNISLPASSQGFTQSLTPTGWRRLPNGHIRQWGTASPAYNGNVSHNLDITLPTTFPNGVLECGVSMQNAPWDGALGHTGIRPLSNSQIRIQSAGATVARPTVFWWAEGH